MAANFLGLFFLILGTTGISNAFFADEDINRNRRSDLYRYNRFDIRNSRDRFRALCINKFGPFACRNVHSSGIDFQIPYRKKYLKMPYPYFGHSGSSEETAELEVNSDENTGNDGSYTIGSTQLDGIVEKNATKGKGNYPVTSADKSGNPTPYTDAHLKSSILSISSSATTSIASDLNVTDKNMRASMISSESSEVRKITTLETTSNSEIPETTNSTSSEPDYKSSLKKESLHLTEKLSSFSTQTFKNSHNPGTPDLTTANQETETPSEFVRDIFTKIKEADSSVIGKKEEQTDVSTFLKDVSVISSSTAPEIKESSEYTFSPTETSSSQKVMPNEQNLKKEEKMFQGPASVTKGETTLLGDKSNSTAGIQSTNNQDSELKTTISQNPSFSETNEISLKIESSASIQQRSSQNFEAEPVTSEKSTIALESKLSSSFEIKSTTTEILENESTTKNFISSSKMPLIPLTDEITEDNIKETSSSTKSSSSKTQITSDAIEKDHVIEISSIRTARIIVSSVFLVIALIAVVVLAVYIFGLKRKAVHYDQLLLLP